MLGRSKQFTLLPRFKSASSFYSGFHNSKALDSNSATASDSPSAKNNEKEMEGSNKIQDQTNSNKTKHRNIYRRKQSIQPAERVLTLLQGTKHDIKHSEDSAIISEIKDTVVFDNFRKEEETQSDITNIDDAAENKQTELSNDGKNMRVQDDKHINFFTQFSTDKYERPLKYGDLIYCRMNNDKKRIAQLKENDRITFGSESIGHEYFIGKEEGVFKTSNKKQILFSRPSLDDYLENLYRVTKVPNTKVLRSMINLLGVQPGDFVLEAGSGSGMLSTLLGEKVGSSGHVYSFDRLINNARYAEKVYRNWKRNCQEHIEDSTEEPFSNVSYNYGMLNGNDVKPLLSQSGFGPFDCIFLDLADPSKMIEHVVDTLRNGKCLGLYIPSPTRIVAILNVIREKNLPLHLETVWEETDRKWVVIQKFNRNSFAWENSLAGWPEQDEEKTAFLVKFRKITNKVDNRPSEENIKDEEASQNDSLSLNCKTFNDGDVIVVKPCQQKKWGDVRSFKLTLRKDSTTTNHFGLIVHNHVIGAPEGKILNTSTDIQFYAVRPTLQDFLEHFNSKVGKMNANRQVRQLSLISSLVEPCESDRLLSVCDYDIGLELLLSQAVSSFGEVHVIKENTNQIRKQTMTEAWQNEYYTQTGHKWKDNITILESNQEKQINVSAPYDGVCLFQNRPELLLREICKVIKRNKYLIVFASRIQTVQNVCEEIKDSKLPLEVCTVYEDKDRQWVIQPVKKQVKGEKHLQVKEELPYVCRPRQHTRSYTSFIMKIRKSYIKETSS